MQSGTLVNEGIVEHSVFIDPTARGTEPPPGDVGPISFLPGTNAVIIVAARDGTAFTASLQASAGQTLTIDFTQTAVPADLGAGAVALSLDGTELVRATAPDMKSVQLPSNARYTLSVGPFDAVPDGCAPNSACAAPLFFTVRID